MKVDGEAQPATVQISAVDTPLDLAQDKATPQVEWALKTKGGVCLRDSVN